jgi:hypothetical protein
VVQRYGKIRPKQVVRCYLRQWRERRDEDFWAWDVVYDVVRTKPSKGWGLVLALIDAAASDEALMYVAAGPLEDLIKLHGYAMAPRIERAAHTNPKLRRALAGVWIDEEYLAFAWWKRQMIAFGYVVAPDTSEQAPPPN